MSLMILSFMVGAYAADDSGEFDDVASFDWENSESAEEAEQDDLDLSDDEEYTEPEEYNSAHYSFILTSGGESSVSAEKDSVVTVTLTLKSTEADEAAEISAFQTELCYDDNVFEYVGSSMKLAEGVEAVDICTDENGRRIRVSYAISGPSELFAQETEIMSFDFKVLDEVGSSKLTQENFLVSNENGTGGYSSSAEDFIILTESYIVPEYSVVFEAMNGDPYDEILITEGTPVSEPETIPVREGYDFSGWYADETYTQSYDFGQPVENSMTLYAKWEKTEEPLNPWIIYAIASPFIFGLILFLVLRKRDKEKNK